MLVRQTSATALVLLACVCAVSYGEEKNSTSSSPSNQLDIVVETAPIYVVKPKTPRSHSTNSTSASNATLDASASSRSQRQLSPGDLYDLGQQDTIRLGDEHVHYGRFPSIAHAHATFGPPGLRLHHHHGHLPLPLTAASGPSGPSGPTGFTAPAVLAANNFAQLIEQLRPRNVFGGPSLPELQQCTLRVRPCDPEARYRTLDGSCNNLKHPTWGMTGASYLRLLAPRYEDGIQAPLNEGLPLPRVLSFTLTPDVELADPTWTVAAMQWSQVVTHDISMAAGSRQHKPHAIRCCAQDGHDVVNNLAEQAGCFPIRIPADDPFYSRHNQRCMDFVRSSSDVANGCSSGPAQQMIGVTSYMDLSIVYGSNDDTLRDLREGRGGRLIVARRGGHSWLPESANRSADCDAADDEEPCYRSGDVRVNQNPGQALVQTILLREHNRLAAELAKLNPHWDDETLLQEARRINVAQVQQITYYEWLPLLIGTQEALRRNLVQRSAGYSHDYDEDTDATALNDHATGAFRHLHTLIPSQLLEVDGFRRGLATLRLSDVFNRPAVIEAESSFESLVRGLTSQPQHAADRFFTAEITQYLFRAGKPFGGDLRSIDIQRGRDHGLPGYNAYRELCGLPRAASFSDFADVMDHEAAGSLAALYNSPDDVDFLVGGGLERNAPGALAGPTFVCVMAEQFRRTRQGDRFWFELAEQPGSFTPGQLQEIRKASLARLMCDNAEGVHTMQPLAFQQINVHNPVSACHEVPSLDLTFWQAVPPPSAPSGPATLLLHDPQLQHLHH